MKSHFEDNLVKLYQKDCRGMSKLEMKDERA